MSDSSYVRIIATMENEGFRRRRGVGYNFHDMNETADFFAELRNSNLSGVHQIRILPTEVNFAKPRDVARGLNNAKSAPTW